ncbi:MAG: glycosyltransferase family 2 protein [Prevotella sp.]|nr:glycosyltransferase family 2 protein [Prevotella sp.]
MEIAIVAVTYNRIGSLNRLLDSLDRAFYPANKDITLIISVDKSDSDLVERFADGFEWTHGEKIVDKHEKNLGLRPHMLSLRKWFSRFDAIVVLEDDIVVSPNFYTYTEQAVEKYHNNAMVAGISLYSFSVNYQTGNPFIPVKDEHDGYFMNCAMSWGEVWMRDSWMRFYDWYLSHQEFETSPHLPHVICTWNQKSWLKYHTRYCIEENKYFLFPYVSLTSNYGEAGEHNFGAASTVYQVELQLGKKCHYSLPDSEDDAICYDGFFENKALYGIMGYDSDELCLDLQGASRNMSRKRYWLTTRIADSKVINSFGLNYRPIEMNIILNNSGHQIYLYDTKCDEANPYRNRKSFLYNYHLDNAFLFVRKYGFLNTIKDFIDVVKHRIGSK